VYDRLGFREQTRYHMHPADPLDAAPVHPPGSSLRQIRTTDIDAIAVLDRHVSGEDRRPLIERFAASGWLLEDGPDARMGAGSGEPSLRAFLCRHSAGNAALIAPRPEDALCLLDLHRHLLPQGGRAGRGSSRRTRAGRRLLAERGRAEWRTFPRMVRGPEPEWLPAAIWGQFNHAMG